MKKATTSQAKNSLSALLVAASESRGDDEGRLARLERSGVLRRGRGGTVEEILKAEPPRPTGRGDVLRALLDERRSGR